MKLMRELIDLTGALEIQRQPLAESPPLMDIAAHLAHLEGTVLLMSGGRLDSARHHILGLHPWLGLKSRGQALELTIDGTTHSLSMDPLEAVRAVTTCFGDAVDLEEDLPLAAGLMGYLAYDLKDELEDLPRTSVDRWGLPQICLYVPSTILVQDAQTAETVLFACRRPAVEDPATAASRWSELMDRVGQAMPDASFSIDAAVHSNFDQAGYESAVQSIRAYIGAGDVYQVNLSQRFETAFAGSPFGFFLTLRLFPNPVRGQSGPLFRLPQCRRPCRGIHVTRTLYQAGRWAGGNTPDQGHPAPAPRAGGRSGDAR
jgi:para-aminobenzoate synthetase component 1